MNIYLHEIRSYRKSTIIWTFSMAALVIVFLSIFPAFSRDVAEMEKLLQGFPESVRKAMGLSIDNYTSLLGYYSFSFLYIMLCGSIQAMILGTSVISREMREKTADFLLTRPVSREAVMTSKLLAALTALVFTNAFYLVVAGITAMAVAPEPFDARVFFLISGSLFFIQLIFMSLGVIVSVAVPRIKSVISVSLGTVMFFFIINLFESVIGDRALRYITPYKYFDSAYIIKNASYEAPFAITAFFFVAAAIAVSYLLYSKKDIHAA